MNKEIATHIIPEDWNLSNFRSHIVLIKKNIGILFSRGFIITNFSTNMNTELPTEKYNLICRTPDRLEITHLN
jgi:hypothetical protein